MTLWKRRDDGDTDRSTRDLGRSAIRLAGPLLGLLVLLVLASGCQSGPRRVVVEINGRSFQHTTRQRLGRNVLRELGLVLAQEDLASFPSEARVARGIPIRVALARRFDLIDDGEVTHLRSHARDVAGVLTRFGIDVGPRDQLVLGGVPCGVGTPISHPTTPDAGDTAAWIRQIRRPIALSVRRSRRFEVRDGSTVIEAHTTEGTVGEALAQNGIVVQEGDQVTPPLVSPIESGLSVSIERSTPIVLDVGGVPQRVRSRLSTVAAVMEDAGITLADDDYVLPSADAPIIEGLRLAVVRVQRQAYVEEVPISFEERWEPDPEMQIDERRISEWGREGAQRKRVSVVYENRSEASREVEDEWVARQPRDRIIEYGTNVVLRELETPEGTITYWRKLRMLATSYNAPTAGKPLDHPAYAITRSGLRARKGIIAVDPRVIDLSQEMYVPEYGPGLAADTGGAIKWRRIDLCYDDDNLVLWNQWVDAYLLAPMPPRDEINWIIPHSPKEKE